MTKVLLSAGSNQNDPRAQLFSACNELRRLFQHVKVSRLYLTEPVGTNDPAPFINAAITLETGLGAPQLLKSLLAIEKQAGRYRMTEVPKGPRNLDLDIILFGNEVWSEPDLTIPHPRFTERRFVLAPAAEIAGEMQDPINLKSIAQHLEACDDHNWVKLLELEVATL